jgi:serine/threonine protein kinase/ligand-binding sensor domain-containing protein
MRVFIAGLFVLAVVSTARPGRADAPDPWDDARPAVRTWSDRDALPQNSGNALAFDARGHLWVGTQDGLEIYDGHAWRAVPLPETARSINRIQAAKDGAVFVGSLSGGFFRFVGGKVVEHVDASNGLRDDDVGSFLETQSPGGGPDAAELWVGTYGGIARRQRGVWKTFGKEQGLPSIAVYSLAETHDDHGVRAIWAATARGLARFDETGFVAVDLPAGMQGAVASLLVTKGATTETAAKERLWVGTSRAGVCLFDGGTCVKVYDKDHGLPTNETNQLADSVMPDGSHAVWVGLDHYGVARIREGAPPLVLDERRGLPGNIVNALAVTPVTPVMTNASGGEGPSRSLWVGLNSRGLARVDLGSWRALDASYGLPSPSVYSVLEAKGQYWVGTLGGLVRWSDGRLVDVGLTKSPVLNLIESKRDGAIWAAVDGGIARMAGTKTTWWRKEDGLPWTGTLALLESQTGTKAGEGVIWFASQGGLGKIEGDKITKTWTEADGLPDEIVIALAETGHTLWVGTMGGLVTLDEGTGVITRHPFGETAADRFILSLFLERGPGGEEVLWVGTKSGPWRATLGSGTSSAFTRLPPDTIAKLPNLVVNHFERDRAGRLYVFTNRGVARLSPDLKDVQVFGVEDGLPSGECGTGASMVDSKGRIWAGTAAGVAILDPSQEIPDVTPKPLTIEHGEELAGVKLRYDRANPLFEFALASFSHEAETRYRTQLVGWESQPSEWTEGTKREYSNLPAGAYAFEVWGRDGAGNVSGPAAVRFTVGAAPWRTWWAYMGYVLAALAFGVSVVRLRERTLRSQNAALEASVRARTNELHEKNDELGRKNVVMAENLAQLRIAERKADEKATELDRNLSELRRVNEQLVASQMQADRIFSAFAEALPGKVLEGKYRLGAKIGAGGFGAVFQATHLSLRRPVAVKVFRPTPGNDSAGAAERFRREGETASLLVHPNAVKVFDAGVSHDGIAYLVMELLEGRTLAEELSACGPRTLERMWQVIAPVCDALTEAHRLGIVHRDIKPSNVFIHRASDGDARDGSAEGSETIKVVDFGIAKLVGDDSDARTKLTMTGGIVGTPTYMAPERLAGKPYDTQSDVYSVGVLAYEMLAGKPPFEQGPNLVAQLMAQLNEQAPPLRTRCPDLPEAVEQVLMRALAADPQKRPTMDELPNELARAAGFSYVRTVSPSGNTKAPTAPSPGLSASGTRPRPVPVERATANERDANGGAVGKDKLPSQEPAPGVATLDVRGKHEGR